MDVRTQSIDLESDVADDPIENIARTQFGIVALHPQQRFVIQNTLDACAQYEGQSSTKNDDEKSIDRNVDGNIDRDIHDRQIIILPTGAGKSLCFQIPALCTKRPTLVIYPLRSLMKDQVRRMQESGIACAVLQGGQSKEDRRSTYERLRKNECRILVSNPETLLQEKTLHFLQEVSFIHLVIDEAHCISEWGKSFRPTYLRIREIIKELSIPVVSAFTATASESVLQDIRKSIFDMRCHVFAGYPDRENISYTAIPTLSKTQVILHMLRSDKGQAASPSSSSALTSSDISVYAYGNILPRPALVFCSQRSRCEMLCRILREELRDADIRYYHAGLSHEERMEIEEWFFHSTNGVLLATCAYGMGVDKSNIRAVVHYDMPVSVENYLQESGRGGRDRRTSFAILLYAPSDFIVRPHSVEALFRKGYQNLCQYCITDSCRREYLLRALQVECEYCSGCDVCAQCREKIPHDFLYMRQVIKKNVRRYNMHDLTLLLQGGKNLESDNKLLWYRPYYGAFSEYRRKSIAESLMELQGAGILQSTRVLGGERIVLSSKMKSIDAYCERLFPMEYFPA